MTKYIMREKMIDIVINTPYVAVSSRQTAGRIVDELIANGATIQPQTNAARIRAMSDEELALLLLDGCRGAKCEEQTQNEFGSVNCYDCRMDWLKKPAEG